MTDHLRRSLAPVGSTAWEQIEEEATRTIRHFLAGRSLVDFEGPKGWGHAAEATGAVRALDGAAIESALRGVQPLVELRCHFEISLAELDRAERGARSIDLDPLVDAASEAARTEDRAIFEGWEAAGITGITHGPHDPVEIGDDYDEYPRSVAKAVAVLRRAGVGGPYAIALGPRCFTGVTETTEHGGYPVLEHMKLILGGPVVWAPAVDGAAVVSTRGGDFRFVCGQDFSIGYAGHDAQRVRLYVEESFTFVVDEPRAAIALRYPS